MISADDYARGVREYVKHQTIYDGDFEHEYEYGQYVISYHVPCQRNMFSCECNEE